VCLPTGSGEPFSSLPQRWNAAGQSRRAIVLRAIWLLKRLRRTAERFLESPAEVRQVVESEVHRGVCHLANLSFRQRGEACRQPLLPQPSSGRRAIGGEQAVEGSRRDMIGAGNSLRCQFGVLKMRFVVIRGF